MDAVVLERMLNEAVEVFSGGLYNEIYFAMKRVLKAPLMDIKTKIQEIIKITKKYRYLDDNLQGIRGFRSIGFEEKLRDVIIAYILTPEKELNCSPFKSKDKKD